MDCSKIHREWGWQSEMEFSDGLAQTIEWYRSHQDWMHEIKDASYLSYYDRMYTHRDDTLSRLHS
jgi:dTDP-glucose 4,6-dehydratase